MKVNCFRNKDKVETNGKKYDCKQLKFDAINGTITIGS
mgnify:FL=1